MQVYCGRYIGAGGDRFSQGSLEVKLPTIWTDEKQRWAVREEKRREEKRREEKKKEDQKRKSLRRKKIQACEKYLRRVEK